MPSSRTRRTSAAARDGALNLVAEVAARLSTAHTEPTVLRALAEGVGAHTRCVAAELTDVDPTDPHAAALFVRPGDAAVETRRVDTRASLASRAAAEGALVVTVPDATHRAAGAPPEFRRAVHLGARALCVLPLGPHEGRTAVATLFLAEATPALTAPVAHALAAVTAGALRQVRLLARVAAVSRRAHAEREQLREELTRVAPPEPVVAVSAAMRRVVYELVDLVARQDTTVMLRGESGTGKEVLARRIHALSPRAGRAFLKVNCGALPEALVESALFGHEKGAFTGAVARHAGFFERANGGTLLLDEVAELPLAAQVKLLRVIQEGEFERVGGETTVKVHVRVIAATHRALEAMVARGTFRRDLFYRLNVFPIEVPPLRARRDDLPALAAALLARLAARHGRAAPALGAATLARLASHDWPGNVRELENVLERALVLSRGARLQLPDGFDRDALPAESARGPSREAPVTFAQAARAAIERALAASRGRIHGPDGAAARLDLLPTTLQSKMKKLGIRRARFVRASDAGTRDA